MAHFQFAVSGQVLELLSPSRGIADNLNTNSVEFEFRSPEWAACTEKWAHFSNPDYNDGTPYDWNLVGDEISPERGLNLPAGIWEVFVHGTVLLDNEVVKRYVTQSERIQILPSGVVNGEPLASIGPSVAEQISALARAAYNMRITAATVDIDDTSGDPECEVSIIGEDGTKILHFEFSGIKSKGISDLEFVMEGENKGRIIIELSDGQTREFDGIKEALAAFDVVSVGAAEAEEDRIAAEIERALAEEARASAETSRASAETERASAESVRASAETSRRTAETSRASAENSRVSAESSRASAETSRINAENARVSAESDRVEAETNRAEAETTRGSAELSRTVAEANRAAAESTRQSNETSRQSAETTRVSNETARASAETARASAESTRQTNEAARVAAETARQTEWEGWELIVSDAEAYARGTRNGVAVDSSDPAYQNSSKYFKEQIEGANQIAQTARAGAEAAQDAAEAAAAVFVTDKTLSITERPADAKVTGDKFTEILISKVDGGYVEAGSLYLTANGEIVAGPFEGIGGGGGGGSGGGGSTNNAVLTLQNTAGWLTKTIPSDSECEISFTWSSLEDNISTGNGTLQVQVNGSTKITRGIAQGSVTLDVGSYLTSGSNSVRVIVSDAYSNSRIISYTINVIAVSISSSFDATLPQTTDIVFPYVPVGLVNKTVYFVLDGTTIGTVEVTTSGRQQTYSIPAQSHGRHTLLVYFTCVVEGETIRSNELYYELICTEEGVTTPIIVSNYRATTVEQYAAQNITYQVYTPSYFESEVTLWENGVQLGSALTVGRTEQTWTYRPNNTGSLTLAIKSGTASRTFNLTVTESSINVSPVTDSLSLYLNSFGRTNTDSNKDTWTYGNISAQFSNFNWVSDGWQMDNEGNTALRLIGDARLTIPYKIFAQDFRSTGKTVEIDFATRNVLNYDAVILSCMSGGRGLSITAQKALFASEQSSVFTQYKEEEHVRVTFVVEKRNTENRLLLCYINGILSGVVQYPVDDDFSQGTPVDITVGSNYCGIDLYCVRVYDNSLTRDQILENFIADTQTLETRMERYERNNILDEYGRIVINKLPQYLPYMVLEAAVLPQYKGDKKTVNGYYVDPANSTNSFIFTNAQADVQGTSSQYYARKNYKIKFRDGFIKNGVASPNYQMRSDSIPTNTFTFKADVASSEGANNVELARLYNDACPYHTPPQQEDERVRQGIDGFPIVMFWDDGTNISFIGKYNFNNDKGTEEVFGFEEGDESWETLNNTSDRVVWKSDDYSGVAWQNDFEGRYPDKNTDATNLAALATWIKSTDQSAATGDNLSSSVTLPHRSYDSSGNLVEENVTYTNDTAAYRLDKFRAELEDHIVVDSALFYYLFTELFLMVDSRAKNAFPTMYQGDNGLWCFLPYDFDTAIGINNEGTLTFGYELEDIDQTSGGANVYNGQNSVLWINIRQGFFEELRTMYRTLRSQGVISYENVEGMFEAHQGKWSEAIFNEDSYYKYIDPLVNGGDGSYLEMCQGSKSEQRKWWLYNRFRYIDSKYTAGDALTDYIDMRSYARSNVTITPYADIYPSMKFGSYFVSTRGKRNTATIIECPGTFTPNDTETQIYCASQLSSVGDLSGLKLGRCDFHMATRLQSLKIGDSSSNYSNGNLTSLTLGNNGLLQTLDVRNCPNLAQAVDISGCTGIEEVYFDGTAITGITLPNGGRLRVLHLPSTVTNVTIRNHSGITDFTMPDYSGITTLRLENVGNQFPTMDILADMAASSRVRLIGVDLDFSTAADVLDFYDLLDTMRGLDENGNNLDDAVISGTIHVPSILGSQLLEMKTRHPNVEVTFDYIESKLYYYNYNGSTLLNTETIINGADGTYSGTPTKDPTEQYTFTFAGWSFNTNSTTADSGATEDVLEDRNVYAAYTSAIRTYTVRFMNGTTVLQTFNNVPYGGSVTYTGTTPVHPRDPANYTFNSFLPNGQNITGATDCMAQYSFSGSITRALIQRTIENVDNSQITTVGTYAFSDCDYLMTVNLPSVTSTGSYAFSSCNSLIDINLPVATTIGGDCFQSCSSLVSVVLPAATTLNTYAIYSCSKLVSVDLPSVTSIRSYGLYNNTQLRKVILRYTEGIVNIPSTSVLSNTSSSLRIYVPDALVSIYKVANNWSSYASKIVGLSELEE